MKNTLLVSFQQKSNLKSEERILVEASFLVIDLYNQTYHVLSQAVGSEFFNSFTKFTYFYQANCV